MMLILPTAMFLAAGSGGGWPSVTIGVADVDNGDWGYVRSGGLIAGASQGYVAAGTLSATLVPEFVTDAVYNNTSLTPDNDNIKIYIVGDCTVQLASVTGLKVDGVVYNLDPGEGPFYISEEGWTVLQIVNGSYWTTSGTHTIQFVE
jgi:hypothetical protein